MTRAGAHEGWAGSTMLGQGCSYIAATDAGPATLVLPGDLVTNCTASAVWLVQHVERGGLAALVAAGITLGDRWKASQVYRVHVSHLQHAPQHARDTLFADLGTGAIGRGRPMAEAPLTWKAHGSTRCVGCSQLLAQDPSRAVVEVEATDYTGARPGYSAARPVTVRRRWHQDCLEEFERASADLRRQVELDRARALHAVAEAHRLARPTSDAPDGAR